MFTKIRRVVSLILLGFMLCSCQLTKSELYEQVKIDNKEIIPNNSQCLGVPTPNMKFRIKCQEGIALSVEIKDKKTGELIEPDSIIIENKEGSRLYPSNLEIIKKFEGVKGVFDIRSYFIEKNTNEFKIKILIKGYKDVVKTVAIEEISNDRIERITIEMESN